MPCPMNGGVRWAASPRRKTLRSRQRSASCARKVYSATRTSSSWSRGMPSTHGPMSGWRGSIDSKSAAVSPSQQTELPAVTGLADAHVRRGAVGVADLVHAFPLVEFDRAGHVDHQPALLELQVLHRGAIAVRTTLLAPSQPRT